MGTLKTRMASLQRRISENWTNVSERKMEFLSSKHHQTRRDVRHRVGHGLPTLTRKKSGMDRLNHDGLSENPQRQSKTRGDWLKRRNEEAKTHGLCRKNEWNHPRNMHEKAAKETAENCSQ